MAINILKLLNTQAVENHEHLQFGSNFAGYFRGGNFNKMPVIKVFISR